ncbi:hypothetical protein CoNPh26_CDS0119 [Staphylococcus phage S-CoN_Ph26]|nr:hypothetical protein CoNPh26_CDS0119 [Staphylococcus phage S-CoN_Ph26]
MLSILAIYFVLIIKLSIFIHLIIFIKNQVKLVSL